MWILIVTDAPGDLDVRIRRTVAQARVTHARPGDAFYEEALAGAEVILGFPPVSDLPRARCLRWLQLPSAGADRYAGQLPGGAVLTCASGVYGVPVAEHVFSLMLAFARGIHLSVRRQTRREWDRTWAFQELHGRTCGILGLGDIGTAVARRAAAFGMRVHAFKRRPAEPPPFVDVIAGLDHVLAESDHVVNVLPETPATRGIINEACFRRIRPGSFFYNVGRGGTVEERALVRALEDGHLGGAGLDVFEEEPLDPGSPLWSMPNVIITPHVAGSSPHEPERVAETFLENIGRYVSGEPLVNVVPPDVGYGMAG